MGETFIAAAAAAGVRFASERETEERKKGSGNGSTGGLTGGLREGGGGGGGILPAICNEQVCNLCVHNFAWCECVCPPRGSEGASGAEGSLISPIERLRILIWPSSSSRAGGPTHRRLKPYLKCVNSYSNFGVGRRGLGKSHGPN